ncbi:MAG TPA: transcriptional regulator [Elusimicrobia bacterium]|nr:transcriptional regulator [Elusimicrobiota bacterium]
MDLATKIFKAVANERRVKIIRILGKKGEMTVNSIANELNLSTPSVSKHLLKLENVGLLKKRQTSKWIYYSINLDKNKRLNFAILKICKKSR